LQNLKIREDDNRNTTLTKVTNKVKDSLDKLSFKWNQNGLATAIQQISVKNEKDDVKYKTENHKIFHIPEISESNEEVSCYLKGGVLAKETKSNENFPLNDKKNIPVGRFNFRLTADNGILASLISFTKIEKDILIKDYGTDYIVKDIFISYYNYLKSYTLSILMEKKIAINVLAIEEYGFKIKYNFEFNSINTDKVIISFTLMIMFMSSKLTKCT
jgi:hypothetical protein